MTDYILETPKCTIIATYTSAGKLKRLNAKKGVLIDAREHTFAELERDIELEYWKKYEVQKDVFFSAAQKEWLTFYKLHSRGVSYRFVAKDGKALKDIGKHLIDISGNTDNAIEVWKLMLKQWNTLDPFYRNKPDLTFINSQLNTILNLLKNGKQTSEATQRSAADDLRRSF